MIVTLFWHERTFRSHYFGFDVKCYMYNDELPSDARLCKRKRYTPLEIDRWRRCFAATGLVRASTKTSRPACCTNALERSASFVFAWNPTAAHAQSRPRASERLHRCAVGTQDHRGRLESILGRCREFLRQSSPVVPARSLEENHSQPHCTGVQDGHIGNAVIDFRLKKLRRVQWRRRQVFDTAG